MKNKSLFIFVLIFSVFGFINLAQAHNPRLVYNLDALAEKPITINKPDISQAFYGRLKGWEEYYRFTITTSTDFYWQTLVPDVKDIQRNVSADLLDEGEAVIATLDAKKSDWAPYFEEYAGDHYFSGPSSTINLEPGTYTIKIYNDSNNEGKYVLVVGQKEVFTAKEVIGTIVNLPVLKTYFNESPLTAYLNRAGLYMGGALLGLLFLYFFIKLIFRMISRL